MTSFGSIIQATCLILTLCESTAKYYIETPLDGQQWCLATGFINGEDHCLNAETGEENIFWAPVNHDGSCINWDNSRDVQMCFTGTDANKWCLQYSSSSDCHGCGSTQRNLKIEKSVNGDNFYWRSDINKICTAYSGDATGCIGWNGGDLDLFCLGPGTSCSKTVDGRDAKMDTAVGGDYIQIKQYECTIYKTGCKYTAGGESLCETGERFIEYVSTPPCHYTLTRANCERCTAQSGINVPNILNNFDSGNKNQIIFELIFVVIGLMGIFNFAVCCFRSKNKTRVESHDFQSV